MECLCQRVPRSAQKDSAKTKLSGVAGEGRVRKLGKNLMAMHVRKVQTELLDAFCMVHQFLHSIQPSGDMVWERDSYLQ
jgi:hypothetical protein